MSVSRIDRRTTLQGIAGSAIVTLPSVGSAQLSARFHGFVVETGTRGWPDYAVGVLVCPDPSAQLLSLRSLRSQALFAPGRRGYFRPLRYSSTDRHRVDFARLAIRHFSQRADMYISMVCAGSIQWPNTAIARDAVQQQMYQRMLGQIRPTFRDQLKLHVIKRTRTGRDLALLNAAKNNIPFVSSIQQLTATEADLMSLASLIVGSVNAVSGGRLVTDATKVQLRTELRGSLGVAALQPAQLNQTGKLRVLKLA